jgi:hypothetical protein
MSPEPTSAPSPVVPGVAFEVERFEWASPDRLELVGRWSGLRGQRFLRPTLDVEVEGERRSMLADLEHKPWAAEEGHDWIAAFTWRGEPARFDEAELTVSPELAVQLPAPGGSVAKGAAKAAGPGAERRPARRPRTAVLEGELAAALAEVERLGEELERARATHSEAGKELRERLRGEHTRISDLETELEEAREQAREQLAGTEAAAEQEAEALRKERDAATAERVAATTERDEAVAAADEARAARDDALKRLRAAEAERDALTEARDRARQERNAWMSRARAAKAGGPSLGPQAAPGRAPAPRSASAAPRGPAPAPGAAPAPRSAPPPGPAPVPGPAPAPDPPPPGPMPAPGTPTMPAERRTIQIGERSGPVRPAPASLQPDGGPRSSLEAWAPRIAAIVALVVFIVVLVLLLS